MKITTLIGMGALAGALVIGCSGSSGSSTGTGSGGDTGGSNGSSGSGNNDTSSSGSSGTGTTSGGGNSSGSAGTSSGGNSSGSTGTSSGGSSSGSASDDAGAPSGDGGTDPETDYTQTKTVTMDSFTVAGGAEVYMCQHFVNPWGKQVDIRTYSLNMSEGSHHMFAFYDTGNSNSGVAACPAGGNTFGAFTFTSQSHTLSQTYPATVGATIPANTGFNMMVHYLNTGTTTLQTSVSVTMYVAKPNVVTEHAGVIFLNDIGILVPPGSSTQSGTPYKLPQDVYVMYSDSHMHKEATGFTATYTPPGSSTGTTLFTTTEWAEPPAEVYSPPLLLKSGGTISWSCNYYNSTSSYLTFGESAATNVMCISTSIFYPVSDVTNPVLGNAASF